MNILDKFYENIPEFNKGHSNFIKEAFGISEIKMCDGAALFGTEQLGKRLLNKFHEVGIRIKCFSDNNKNKWKSEIEGIKVVSPDELRNDYNQMVIIASKYVREIYKQLHKNGFKNIIPHYVLTIAFPDFFPNPFYQRAVELISKNRKKIEKIYNLLADRESKNLFLRLLKFRISLLPADLPVANCEQYYPGNFWKLEELETYVDVGAFDGDTLKQFLSHAKGNFHKYIALEPDINNYKKLLENIPAEYKDKIIPFLCGAGEKNDEVNFMELGRDDSFITKKVGKKIKIVTLDKLCAKEKVTTIKIDVEGYEPEVLMGTHNIIKVQKPKLAVCVYHRPSHLWEIPSQIMSYNRNYKFYLRHHEPEIYGTVLYAV